MILSLILIFIALLHFVFLYLQMFLWDRPMGRRIFQMNESMSKQSKILAMNQGLYNGFLASGLIWSLFKDDDVKIFFLMCVFVAGIFGAFTANKRIFYIQVLPAIAAFIFLAIK